MPETRRIRQALNLARGAVRRGLSRVAERGRRFREGRRQRRALRRSAGR